MKKIILGSLLVSVTAVSAFAEVNNVGTCGWGSKLFEGNDGIAPQVLAVTTNGTFGNQTFAITSGTSGCTQGGVVRSNWKTVMFIEGNKTRLAQDIATGEGESLASLSKVVGVEAQDEQRFAAGVKSNFSNLFPSEEVTAGQVTESLKSILLNDEVLAKYTSRV